MEHLINILNHLPGVAGLWYYKDGTDPSYRSNDTIKKDTLKEMALQLSTFFSFAETEEFPMKVVRFTFDTYNTIGIKLPDTSLLLILCEPQANPSLIVNIVDKMQLTNN